MRVLLIISVLRIGLPHSVFKQIAILHVRKYILVIFVVQRQISCDKIYNNYISIFVLVEISRYDVSRNSFKLQLFEALPILGCIGMS